MLERVQRLGSKDLVMLIAQRRLSWGKKSIGLLYMIQYNELQQFQKGQIAADYGLKAFYAISWHFSTDAQKV